MERRQDGASMAQVVEVAISADDSEAQKHDNEVTMAMITVAYAEPKFRTAKYQQEAVIEYCQYHLS